ncbi:ribonuclease H-like domain-containing protein [Tanacetum coccineum]
MARDDAEVSTSTVQETTHMVSSMKLPMLKKGEYTIWAIRMEEYLIHTDYEQWLVVLNGNSPVHYTKNEAGKDVEKSVLKQQFKAFSISNSEGLDKGFDRFQRLLTLLSSHGAKLLTEDINFKFLRSLPSTWTSVSLIMRNKEGINDMDIDDLYNTLKAHEGDVKGTTISSSSQSNKAQGSSSYVDEVMYSFFANQSSTPQLDHNDLEQIDNDDFEEMDLKWQVAMISTRINKFYKRTGRKLQFDRKEPVGYDKTKVECFNCHKKGHFARECRRKKNQEYRGNNNRYRRDDGKRSIKEEDQKALVVQDITSIGTYDWSYLAAEEELINYALMAITSSKSSSSTSSDTKVNLCSKACIESYNKLQKMYDGQRVRLDKAKLESLAYELGLKSVEAQLVQYQENEVILEEKIGVLEWQVKDKTNLLTYHKTLLDLATKEKEEILKEKEDLKAKLKKFENSSKNLTKLLDSQISPKVKIGLGYGKEEIVCDVSKSDVFKTVFDTSTSDKENSQTYDRFKKVEEFHAVPPPLSGNFIPPKADLSFAGLDDSVYTSTAVIKDAPKSNEVSVETPKEVKSSASLIQDWDTDSVNESIFRPKQVFEKVNFIKEGEYVRSVKHAKSVKIVKSVRPITAVKPIQQTKKPKESCSSPKVDKRDWNRRMAQNLGLGTSTDSFKRQRICRQWVLQAHDRHQRMPFRLSGD